MAHNRYGILFALVMLSACQPAEDPDSNSNLADANHGDTPFDQLALRSVADCDALKSRFVDHWAESLIDPYRAAGPVPVVLPVNTGPLALTMETTADAPDQVSRTNIQEQGVDEADYVKADASGHLYVAHQTMLLVEKAFPPDAMQQLAALELGGQISGIYLEETGNTLLALVRRQGLIFNGGVVADVTATDSKFGIIEQYKPSFDLVVIDISDKSAPTISNRIRIDGWLVSSRRIGGRLHVLSRQHWYPYRWLHVDPKLQPLLDAYRRHYAEDDEPAYREIGDNIRDLLRSNFDTGIFDELLPKVGYPLQSGVPSRVLLDCDSIFTPAVGLIDSGLMTLSSIDVDGGNLSQLGLLGSGWLTYATQKDFFLAANSNGWWWSRRQRQQTVVHHFSIGQNKPEYVASGLVPGHINDSFSMSYHDDVLRLATTSWANAGILPAAEPSNHLLTLHDNGSGVMKTIGAVRAFAAGERIFSARFFHDKAFVVTFRLVDPLFAFDLSDATNPRIVSELKIPGFSHYIHPVNADTLLTIGRNGDDAGLSDDIAVKLFDVSDLSAMRLLDNYVPNTGGYSSSSANWDHHAFTYYAPLDLLSIPVISYDHQNGEYFSGIVALDIDLDAGLISELGRVDHADLLQQSCVVQDAICGPKDYFRAWLSQPNRSVVMQSGADNYLYSVSNIGLKANDLANLELTIGSLLFPPRNSLNGYYLY